MYWVVIVTIRLSGVIIIKSTLGTYVLAEGISTSHMAHIVFKHDHLRLIVLGEVLLRVGSAAWLYCHIFISQNEKGFFFVWLGVVSGHKSNYPIFNFRYIVA